MIADIHEEVRRLSWAIDTLRAARVDRFIMLGDVFDHGERIDETVAALAHLNALGVWGNHDFGLCRDVSPEVRARHSTAVVDYFASLAPSVVVEDCWFQHIGPALDAEVLDDLWSFDEGLIVDHAAGFARRPERVLFLGHLHRWKLFDLTGPIAWDGASPIRLAPEGRFIVVVHAIQQGHCASYDTASGWLVPYRMA